MIDGDWVESKDQDPDGDIRLLQLADIGVGDFLDRSSRYMTSSKANQLKCTYIQKGDILVARMPDPIGRACQFPGDPQPCVTVVDVCVLRPDSNVADSKYVTHILNSSGVKNQLDRFVKGATRQRISRTNLEQIPIPLPPLPEQRRIAAILDQADLLRAKRRRALVQLHSLTQAIFIEIFGDPIHNSKGWRIAPLRSSAERIQIGPFGSQLHEEDYINDGIPLINPTHIKNAKICPDPSLSISEEKYNQLSQYHLAAGDLVLGRRGEMGRCAVVTTQEHGWLCGTGSLFIRPKADTISSTYLSFVISSASMRRHLENVAQGVTMANLNKDIVGSLSIPVPPMELQREFISQLAVVEGLQNNQHCSLADLNSLFSSLQNRAFRGKL